MTKFSIGQEVVFRGFNEGLTGRRGRVICVRHSPLNKFYLIKFYNWRKGHNAEMGCGCIEHNHHLTDNGWWCTEDELVDADAQLSYYKYEVTDSFKESESLEEKAPKRRKGLMSRLSTIAKKLLDSDTKTLIKAYYLDEELDLTAYGQEALLSLAFEAHKAELVKLAKEKIKEEEKKY